MIITLKKLEELVSFYVGVNSKVSPCYLIAISDAKLEQSMFLKAMTRYSIGGFILDNSITLKQKLP